MAIEYRDYGSIGGNSSMELYGQQVQKPTTQVYKATHIGELRLPYMNRSFISFSYGGKNIEDFNLIAYNKNDQMSRDLYASFVDTTTEYDNLDGQSYWKTHYRTMTLDLSLVTDGITDRELDEFKQWFRPGEAKELILAEHPNRGILARIAAPPKFELLPFESQVEVMIIGDTFTTSTTLYKGTIDISFVADTPFWYALQNILGIYDGERILDKWINANGVEEDIHSSKDALKIIYEDGIPVGSMIDANMLFGDGTYADVTDNIISLIWAIDENDPSYNPNTTEVLGARIDDGTSTFGILAGAVIDNSGNGIVSLSKNAPGYFFYAGTAPAFTEITFSITPNFNGSYYIVNPCSKWSKQLYASNKEYNTITVKSQTTQELVFTIPNIYSSYNKVLDVFDKYVATGEGWEEVYKQIRDKVRHPAVRAWAAKVLDYGKVKASSTPGIISTGSIKSTLNRLMAYFFCDGTSSIPQDAKFTFNSETGRAIGKIKYRTSVNAIPQTDSAWQTYGLENFIEREEDVGDMLRSNHLIIRDRNYARSDGHVVAWEDNSTGRSYSHVVTHDVDGGLKNFLISYKNMYL